MINTVFGFGAIPENETEYEPLIGSSQEEQYDIATTLLVIVVTLIPIMLLVRPLFCRKQASVRREEEEIEL